MEEKVALITGAARRIGAHMARYLHQRGYSLVIHYRHHQAEAAALCQELNQIRANSAVSVAADFDVADSYKAIIEQVVRSFGRLDVLVNNASSYFPTQVGQISEKEWDHLINPNLKAPLFLSQAAYPLLKQQRGCIVNVIDINATHPKNKYLVYCIAKAGLWMLTQGLALELGPEVRVNAVAPGAIMWPEGPNVLTEDEKQSRISQLALKRKGDAEDIAQAAWYFIQASFVTGQMLAVDGGSNS